MHSDTQLFCIVCELLCIVIKLFCIGFELSVWISSALRLTSATSPHVLYICSSSQLNESMMYWVQFYLMCCSPEAAPCGLLMWSYSSGGEQLLFVALKVMHNTSSVWATYEGKVRFQVFVSSLTSWLILSPEDSLHPTKSLSRAIYVWKSPPWRFLWRVLWRHIIV